MRRCCGLVIIAVFTLLIAASFSACVVKRAEGGNTGNSPSQNSETLEDREEIEIVLAMSSNPNAGKDDIAGMIYDALKIKLKFVPEINDGSQIMVQAVSGDLPDIWMTDVAEYVSDFNSFIEKGLIRSIPESMLERYPGMKTHFENSPEAQASKAFRKEYYFIPKPMSYKGYYKSFWTYIYYRKDWMSACGIQKVPETVDELYQMLYAFAYDDPDNNGKRDTYGLSMVGIAPDLYSVWGPSLESWYEEDGKWKPGYVSKAHIDALKFFRRLYQDGLLDPEFAYNGFNQMAERFARHRVGSIAKNGDPYWADKIINEFFGHANKEMGDPLQYIGILPPLKRDAESKPRYGMAINAYGNVISSKVDDEKLMRILELCEYIKKPEIETILRYGFEGREWIRKENRVEIIKDNEGKIPDVYRLYPTSRISELVDWGYDKDIEGPRWSEGILKMTSDAREKFNEAAVIENLVPRMISTRSKDSLNIDFSDAYIKIIMSNENVETMFDSFIKSCEEKGLSQAIDEVTLEMSRLKG